MEDEQEPAQPHSVSKECEPRGLSLWFFRFFLTIFIFRGFLVFFIVFLLIGSFQQNSQKYTKLNQELIEKGVFFKRCLAVA